MEDQPREQLNRVAVTGSLGEQVAARYLARRGCSILARNWQAHPGEIDIIAECPAHMGKTLVFAEVRTRRGRRGLAEESISRRKAANMASAASSYMVARDLDPEATLWRIDLIAIAMSGPHITSINWIQGAIEEGAASGDEW